MLPYHKFGVAKYERVGVGYSLLEVESPSQEAVAGLLALAERENVRCTL